MRKKNFSLRKITLINHNPFKIPILIIIWQANNIMKLLILFNSFNEWILAFQKAVSKNNF